MPRGSTLIALALLATAGHAASVAAVHILDPAGDVEFDYAYWAGGFVLSGDAGFHLDLPCTADDLDIRSVDFAATAAGTLRASMSVADLDSRVRCASTGTPLDPLPLVTPEDQYAVYELSLSAGNATRPHWIGLSLDRRDEGPVWSLQIGDAVWPPLCLDSGWWLEGDTLGFTVPVEGTARRCGLATMDTYSFRGTSVAGSARTYGYGEALLMSPPYERLGWTYWATDGASDPSQRVSVP